MNAHNIHVHNKTKVNYPRILLYVYLLGVSDEFHSGFKMKLKSTMVNEPSMLGSLKFYLIN